MCLHQTRRTSGPRRAELLQDSELVLSHRISKRERKLIIKEQKGIEVPPRSITLKRRIKTHKGELMCQKLLLNLQQKQI